jgi:hypothetical protein
VANLEPTFLGSTDTQVNRGYTRITEHRAKQSEWVFLSMVDLNLLTGCWIWTGAFQGHYGVYYDPGKRTSSAHRYSYEKFVGPIPVGKHLDHLCRNPACVNPGHLEPVTVRENLHRAHTSWAARNAAKTHCPKGHPLSGDNVYIHGGRQCRTCKVEWNREYRAAKKVAVG